MLRIGCAEPADLDAIVGLIDGAAAWLRTKDTDQWENPWPNRSGRDTRVKEGIDRGKTWIVRDDEITAGTITMDTEAHPKLWPEMDVQEPAVYVHRLVVNRKFAGKGIGASLVELAGDLAFREYAARWIRVDVWDNNTGLHNYYRNLGFMPHSTAKAPEKGYRSTALFQRAIAESRSNSLAQFAPEQGWPGPALKRPRGLTLHTSIRNPFSVEKSPASLQDAALAGQLSLPGFCPFR
jgi:ribosomal protein S18 acetylase RimI-like enzyme